MTKEQHIEKLETVKAIFVGSLDGLPTYYDIEKGSGHILIEGIYKGKKTSVSFFYNEDKEQASIVVNRPFPKHPQEITPLQFLEWMDKPIRTMMQDQDFELSEGLKKQIKKHFKTL